MDVREASASYSGLTELPGGAVSLGYKQTEVGLIPEDWQFATLLSLAGSSKDRFDDGDWIEAEFLAPAGIRLIQTGNLGIGRFVDKETKKYISEASFEKLRCKDVLQGDLLVCRLAEPAGRACIVPSLDDARAITAVDVTIFRPVPAIADKYFLLQYFCTSQWFSAVSDRCGGSTRSRIARGTLGQIEVPIPPTLAEQQAIAEALSDADALIESLEQLIAKKRQIKQGTMQALLTGKQRLPGFASDWVANSLGDLSSIRGGGTPSTTQSQFWDGDILWCTPTDITGLKGKKYLSDTNRKITAQGLQSSSAELIPANSIVMTSRATIGECAINVTTVATNQGFKNFIPFDEVDVEFLYYLLLMQTEGFIRLCAGSTFLEIGKTQLASFEVLAPPTKAEQTAIATVLSDMDTELAELETRLAKTHQLKQGMMQELLTGRIRLVRPASSVVPLPKKNESQAATTKKHNPQINEAVVIAALTRHFGSEDWPLARVRRTKLAYLLHRHAEGQAVGFLKKAAGPYDPSIRYKGPEGIALKKGYVRTRHNGKYEGFVVSENIAEAEAYFEKWYGADVMAWLEQFHMRKTEELELLTTVDMAVEDLRREGKSISAGAVKQLIHDHPEWKPKLDRVAFSDAGIAGALAECQALFAS
ncbi:restriction endonuclease subunit S [Rhodanobacter sp. Root480]|uniref:restriction endonuclease subunit S n=1 Tax=Rhodanobacter sp. Root480 TaxID=1736542 RepID=UPI0009EBD1C9|nr:restriction endonuclease subunit S [Rhodanobacter sp. Root480]